MRSASSPTYAVIMAGGSGTRLWPLSRRRLPKQFHSLISDQSLLQETHARLTQTVPVDRIYVATLDQYKDRIRRELPEIPARRIFLEPNMRNTAPAIAMITRHFATKDPSAIIGTFASDHAVTKPKEFARVVKVAYATIQAHPDHLMVIGVKPTFPDTGKGYIQLGKLFETRHGQDVFRAKRFVEKPSHRTAQRYIGSRQYLWNASYFIFRAGQMDQWFRQFHPEIINNLDHYGALPSIPIDSAIAERVKKLLVMSSDMGWSDVGSWDIVHDVLIVQQGKPVVSRGVHISYHDENCLVFGSDRLIATIGLKNMIVIDTPDALLIVRKEMAQDVRHLVEELENRDLRNLL